MRYDVMNEYYTEIRLFGKPALFNDMRLDQETVPKGLYLYEVRYDDETWEPVQIAKGILANHLGSVKAASEFFRRLLCVCLYAK